MPVEDAVKAVRETLQRFQDGYSARDTGRLEAFMELFVQGDESELIGVGAAERGGSEWFQGAQQVREIVESDWKYWGDVNIDVAGARISVLGEVAWLSTSGMLVQTQSFDVALGFYVQQMKELLEDEAADLDGRLMEATHFGVRRLRERHKGLGHGWPFVFTAVLVNTGGTWRFHAIHWSMPVD